MAKDNQKKHDTAEATAASGKMSRKEFEKELAKLQVELTSLQTWVKDKGARVVVIFEGRDTAGKGGVISRITARTSPRVFRHVALPAPSDREKTQVPRLIANSSSGRSLSHGKWGREVAGDSALLAVVAIADESGGILVRIAFLGEYVSIVEFLAGSRFLLRGLGLLRLRERHDRGFRHRRQRDGGLPSVRRSARRCRSGRR
jgi:hypothetical protein